MKKLDEPVACTLTPGELRAREGELLPGLVRRASSIGMLDDGCELRFAPAPDLLAFIARVVDAERQCCRFFTFDLRVAPEDGPITLRVTGPPGTRAVLESLLSPEAR